MNEKDVPQRGKGTRYGLVAPGTNVNNTDDNENERLRRIAELWRESEGIYANNPISEMISFADRNPTD